MPCCTGGCSPTSDALLYRRVLAHIRPGIDPEKTAQASGRLATHARSALTGRAFAESLGFAAADLLFGLFSMVYGVSEIVVGVQMRRTGQTLQAVLHDAAA